MSDDLQLQDCVRHKQKAIFFLFLCPPWNCVGIVEVQLHSFIISASNPIAFFRGGGEGIWCSFGSGLSGPYSLSEHYEIEDKGHKNVTLKRIRATIFAVEKRYVLRILSVCL